MGCFDIFCTLCGGPLNTGELWDSLRSPNPDPSGSYWDYNQDLLVEADLEWLRDVRILAEWRSAADGGNNRNDVAQNPNDNVAAEVYYASEFDTCSGPFDATSSHGLTHWCYAFMRGECEDSYSSTHFVMHSACLLIARRYLFSSDRTIQDLYNALLVYHKKWDFIGVFLPNQHYGAQLFWHQSWLAVQGWEFLVKDPVNVSGLTGYIVSKLQSLPPEDRPTAPGSSIGQEVYRKQLLSGQLFALQDSLDLDLVTERWEEIKDKDWRRLVQKLARYDNFSNGEGGSEGGGGVGELCDAPIGLKNRMRIVKIMQDIFTGVPGEK